MLIILGLALVITLSLSLATVSAANATASTPSVCCERTKSGALCINTVRENCSSGQISPTSCEATSYCRLGTCYDSKEGLCMENTPQTVCKENGGTWDVRKSAEIPQCQLGCCVLADQAAYVPLVRCKRLATLYGLQADYRTDIDSEMNCIATAQSQDMGACVYDQDFVRTCKFTTRKECGAEESILTPGENTSIESGEKAFYSGVLCSAEELGTDCARQTKTGCYQQKVYWFDSCGNRENVYSTDLAKSWNNGRVAKPEEVCPANNGNIKTCGNCDYLLGSRCDENTAGKPDFACKRTDCTDSDGNPRLNGESWCVYDGGIGNGTDPVGSRHYKEVCVDGKVRVEPCADFRQQICIQGGINSSAGQFSVAACRVNRWQDCVLQTRRKDCENQDRRDCFWLPKVKGMLIGGGGSSEVSPNNAQAFTNPNGTSGQAFTNPTGKATAPVTGMAGDDDNDEENANATTNRPDGVCVPNYPPGFDFWTSGDASGICSQAAARCVVKYEKGLLSSSKKCVENCECLEDVWAQRVNRVCTSLGDCGAYANWVGKYTNDGYDWKIGNKSTTFSANVENKIKEAGKSGKEYCPILGIEY